MAFIVSALLVPDQAAHLREYLHSRGATLPDTAAQNICRSIELNKPGESKLLGRRLVAALAAHGVVIKYSNALEALAQMCGEPNWMRALQASLPFGDATPQEVVYVLQAARNGETYVAAESFANMPAATDRLLKLLATEWPTTMAVSLATLGISSQLLYVELEHPTAPWLDFKLCRITGTGNDVEMSDLPPAESVAFCDRLTRTLEYTYPGLLVLNSMRSSTLEPPYYLCPEVHRVETGDRLTCWGDLELLPVLDSMRGRPDAALTDGVLRFDSEQGPIEVTPIWTSNADPRHLSGGMSSDQLNSLLNRLARLRRITGGNITQHLGRVMTGAERADEVEDHTAVDKSALETAMREANLTSKQLALLAQLPLNAVQRVVKYGYAHESVVPKLSDALGLAHPNALLPKERDHGVGYRIEDGATFLNTLKKTHMWRRIVSESLQGEEGEEVNRIAEALQDYVEVLQFRVDPANVHPPEFAAELTKPVDEVALARTVQELLDDLREMDVAVIVTTNIRYWHSEGRLQGMNGMPLHNGTLVFERVEALRSARATNAAAV